MAESLWIFPFGKFKGKPIEDIPKSYLEYMLEQNWFCDKFSNKIEIVQKQIKFLENFPNEEKKD